MAEVTKTETTTAATDGGNSFIKRELNGATFLTLEHVLHMALVVAVAALLVAGILTAIDLWTGNGGVMSAFTMMAGMGIGTAKYAEASSAIGIVAALVILVPGLVILDRRTRAEWLKRDGYAGRVAYKVPLYTALGLLVVAKVVAVIQMVTVVLNSLAVIGLNNNGVGDMYLYEFLPAAIAALVFGGSAWYLFKLAKGRDNGKMFSMLAALLGAALAIALFVTAVVTLHGNSNGPGPIEPAGPTMPYYNNYNTMPNGGGSSSKSLDDLFKY